MMTQEQKEKYDAAVRLILKGADRLFFDKKSQTLGSGDVYIKLADVITSINLMYDVLKEVEAQKVLDVKDKVVVFKGHYTLSQLQTLRTEMKKIGALGIMSLGDEEDIDAVVIDAAIDNLKKLKEKQNG